MEIDELLDRRLMDGRTIADSDVRKLVDAYRAKAAEVDRLQERHTDGMIGLCCLLHAAGGRVVITQKSEIDIGAKDWTVKISREANTNNVVFDLLPAKDTPPR